MRWLSKWSLIIVLFMGVFAVLEERLVPSKHTQPTTAASDHDPRPYIIKDAIGIGVVPGALVCPDYPTFNLVLSLYNQAWEENNTNVVTNGAWEKVNGPPSVFPDLERNGCALFPPGTPIRTYGTDFPAVVIVSGKLPDGDVIHGITLPGMLH